MVTRIEHRSRTGCPVACSLDLIGDHWTLLIVRNLMFLGKHEYKDMLDTDERISSAVLTDRLKKLEAAGLVAAIDHPESRRRKLYYLLPAGRDLVHVMTALVLWAHDHLAEHLRVPPDTKALLETDPDAFVKMTLERLDAWEQQYLDTVGGGAA